MKENLAILLFSYIYVSEGKSLKLFSLNTFLSCVRLHHCFSKSENLPTVTLRRETETPATFMDFTERTSCLNLIFFDNLAVWCPGLFTVCVGAAHSAANGKDMTI